LVTIYFKLVFSINWHYFTWTISKTKRIIYNSDDYYIFIFITSYSCVYTSLYTNEFISTRYFSN